LSGGEIAAVEASDTEASLDDLTAELLTDQNATD
jgi:hypothetical protein